MDSPIPREDLYRAAEAVGWTVRHDELHDVTWIDDPSADRARFTRMDLYDRRGWMGDALALIMAWCQVEGSSELNYEIRADHDATWVRLHGSGVWEVVIYDDPEEGLVKAAVYAVIKSTLTEGGDS